MTCTIEKNIKVKTILNTETMIHIKRLNIEIDTVCMKIEKYDLPTFKYVPFLHPLPYITHVKWYFSAKSVVPLSVTIQANH